MVGNDRSSQRGRHTMVDHLAGILDAANSTGAAVKKREGILTVWLKLTVHSHASAVKIADARNGKDAK